MRAVLALALLVTLAMPFATALCMRMEQPQVTGASIAAVPEPAAHSGDPVATAIQAPAATSRHACCERQRGGPKMIASSNRFMPSAPEALPVHPEAAGPYSGLTPPGWSDFAREKPGHLSPSLTALSISRT